MLCTTCHDPHAAAKVEAAACQKCHASGLEQRVKAGLHTPATNCVDCHMPKRRTEDVIHVVVTDHWIERRPPAGDLLADRPERRDAYRGAVALYYPETLPHTPENELYLALAQVKQGSNLVAGIAQLTSAIAKASPARAEWYLELGEALERNGQLDKAVPEYRRAATLGLAKPGLSKLGSALRRSGHPAEAIDVLKRAPASPANWNELGLAYEALGKTSDAVAAINNALRLDPDLAEAHNNLGSVRLTSRDPKRAEPAFREAIRIRPDYADAHANLAEALSGSDHLTEAQAEFEIALRLRPVDAPTRYNYAVMLARMNRTEDAERELETALRNDGNFADAHLLLGDLLMVQNKGKEAAPHYVEALRLLPNSDRGHLGLGAALASQGDLANAKVHLNRAAASTDAAIREQAMQILSQLR
jgi:tetratricopeptide (TPR) repeat protein